MRFLVAAALAAFILSGGGAAADPSIVVDARTGEVLHADEATRPWHPASTTKMMTAYLLLKAMREGRIGPDTPLRASKNAAGQRPSKAGIKAGQVITADNALKIMMVKSANDIAVVIAENLSGSVAAFADDMNREAQRLGMRESRWINANGWHDARQQTSARDLAILARALWYEFPEFHGYWGIGSLQLGKSILKNTNGLVGRYPGVVGMKTGFVCASGFNLVAMAERNGRLLISVVLGTGSGPERTVASARLLDEAFDSGGFFTSKSTGYSLATLPASGYAGPTNVRDDVCGKGRKAFSLSEEESDAPVVYSTTDQDFATSPLGLLMRGSARPAASSSVSSRNGKMSLGERVLGAPVPVFFGAAPGSVAAPAIAAVSAALPGLEPAQPAERLPGAISALPADAGVAGAVANQDDAAGEPLMLPGVELAETPSAAGSLAPPPRVRMQDGAKPGAIAAGKPKTTKAKPAGKKPVAAKKKKPAKKPKQ
jgi:D-alanyl-D-alanine carboxypeptidase